MMLLKTCSCRDVKKSCLSTLVKCLTHDHETMLKVDKVGLCTQMNIL